MATLPVMPLYTDALMGDCGYMPNAVFGAFMKMLFQWWRAGAKPMSASRLKLMAGCSDDEFEIIRAHLTETADGFTQKKLFNLYAEQLRKVETARKNGKAGGRPKKAEAKPENNREVGEGLSHNEPAQKLSMNHEPSSLSDDKLERAAPSGAPALIAPILHKTTSKGTGKRLPPDWEAPRELIMWAVEEEGFSEDEAKRETEKFRDYWISQSGSKGQKADWDAAFRTWVRRERDDRDRRGRCQQPQSVAADLLEFVAAADAYDKGRSHGGD